MAFKRIDQLVKKSGKRLASLVRDGMDRDIQAFAISDNTFKDLAQAHITELRRLAQKVDDPAVNSLLTDTPNLSLLSKKLKVRFIEIFEKNLDRRKKTLRVNKIQKTGLTIYVVRRVDRRRSAGETPFKVLQAVLTDTRKDLVNNSKIAGSSIDKGLSITVAGIDVDYDDFSVDQQQFYKSKKLDTNPLRKGKDGSGADDRYKGAGAELGHTRGAAIVAADRLIRALELNLKNSIKHAGILTEARNLRDSIEAIDAEFTLELNSAVLDIVRKDLGLKSNISIITLEQTALNRQSGRLALDQLNKLTSFLRKHADTIITGSASKPLIREIVEQFEQLFLYNKTKKVRVGKTFKSKTRVKSKGKTLQAKIKGSKNSDAQTRLLNAANTGSSTNLPQLIGFLNSRLHDQIKENMGKGQAKQQLNYRTGRFANSAKIEALYEVSEKNAIGAQVKYLRYPYGVFEKGGRLHKPLRDPKLIFGKSIRQLLQQEKIANLRRVIVNLNG